MYSTKVVTAVRRVYHGFGNVNSFFNLFMLIYFLQNPFISLSLIPVSHKPSGWVEYSNYVCMLSHSIASDSLWPNGLQPARLPRPWDSPGKNTGVGCHFILWCQLYYIPVFISSQTLVWECVCVWEREKQEWGEKKWERQKGREEREWQTKIWKGRLRFTCSNLVNYP